MWLAFALVLLVGLALRLWAFPSRYFFQTDETGYLYGGPCLIESIVPAGKAAPGGPEFWIGWLWVAGHAARYFILPTPEEHAAPFMVRPFIALDHALFDTYYDISSLRQLISCINLILGLLAIAAVFRLGARRAGLAGAILAGGVLAALPLAVHYGEMGRPYSMAWSFAILAICRAAGPWSRRKVLVSALFMGLAIASRIDMLVLLPLMLLELAWVHRDDRASGQCAWSTGRLLIRATVMTAIFTLLFAPWLLTSFVGVIRTIATIQIAPPPGRAPTVMGVLREFGGIGPAIEPFEKPQGLAIAALLVIAGLIVAIRNRAPLSILLAIYIALLTLSLLKTTGYGIHHKAAVVMAYIVTIPTAIAALNQAMPRRLICALIAVAIALPMFQTIGLVRALKRSYVPDDANNWIRQHIAAGAPVYVSPSPAILLPTPESADRIWQTVSDVSMSRKKFQTGLARFNLSANQIPRALSEENMTEDRGNVRCYFILGSRPDVPESRYDLHLFGVSPLYGSDEQTLQDFFATGGALIWRAQDCGPPPSALGRATVEWTRPGVAGTYIFVRSRSQP